MRQLPVMFCLGCTALFILFTALGFLNMQVMLVMTQRTTLLYNSKRFLKQLPPRKRMMKNLTTFLKEGLYNISYPRLPKPACNNLPPHLLNEIELEPAPSTIDPHAGDGSEYGDALKMLEDIDKKLNPDAKREGTVLSVATVPAAEQALKKAKKWEGPSPAWMKLGAVADEPLSYDFDLANSRHNKRAKKHYMQEGSDDEGDNDQVYGEDEEEEEKALPGNHGHDEVSHQSHDHSHSHSHAHDHGHDNSNSHRGHGCKHDVPAGPTILGVAEAPKLMRIASDDRA
jgi:hypothetical protein